MGMFMESDAYFVLASFGAQIAGVVDVPIYLTHPAETIAYVINHSESTSLVVSNDELMEKVVDVLKDTPDVKNVVIAETSDASVKKFQSRAPEGVTVHSMEGVQARGRKIIATDPQAPQKLRKEIDPKDLAIIIYTSGTTGMPKGVLLTHENLTSNMMGAFSILTEELLEIGAGEDALSFLPMTHIFARMVVTGHVYSGHTIYFSNPDRLAEHLQEVKPTVFCSVPRVLEKVYDKIMLKGASLTGVKRKLFDWSMSLAEKHEVGDQPNWKLNLARKLVFSKWQEALGGRLKGMAVGGAALRKDLNNTFDAAGVLIIQGYGLTETSPVITFNRPNANKAGTVGQALEGVEVAIAEDGEILARGPNIMQGYYKMPEKTAETIDTDGWFHTGDIGEFDTDGFLRITDRKKDLFKLSTGKYVMPSPIESNLLKATLVEQAVVIGSGYNYCTALLFPNQEALAMWADDQGIAKQPIGKLVRDPKVMAEFERLVNEANKGMPHWSQVQRFRVLPNELTVENKLLTPTMKVKRSVVSKEFGDEIAQIYAAKPSKGKGQVAAV